MVTVFDVFAPQSARADDEATFLKAMTEYTATQKAISATFDNDIEVVMPELKKVQLTSSGRRQLARPDKMPISRTGGYVDVQLAGAYYGSSCGQVVDAYCRITTRC